jgi:hypothetical protein
MGRRPVRLYNSTVHFARQIAAWESAGDRINERSISGISKGGKETRGDGLSGIGADDALPWEEWDDEPWCERTASETRRMRPPLVDS